LSWVSVIEYSRTCGLWRGEIRWNFLIAKLTEQNRIKGGSACVEEHRVWKRQFVGKGGAIARP